MKVKWQDITPYSKGDTERDPRIYRASFAGLEISLARYTWRGGAIVMHCYELRVPCRELGSTSWEEAKRKAAETVKEILQKRIAVMTAQLQALCN